MATVGTLSENPEGLATFEANEEYDLHELYAIAGALLGCPFTIDEETGSVEFDESPDLHRGFVMPFWILLRIIRLFLTISSTDSVFSRLPPTTLST